MKNIEKMNNKLKILLLVGILLLSSMPLLASQPAQAAPPSIIYQAPITIDNTQSTPTPNPFQQMIQLKESTYKPYISYTGSTANFEFSYANNTIIPAWIESNNSGVLTIWLKLYSIPALSSITIYIDFASLTTNLLSSSGTAGIGEAPQLSPTYGEYDDGASVFSLYSNFYDSLAGYHAYNLNGDSNYYVPTPTTSPYYSVELLDNSGGVGAYILSPNNISLGNYILQAYWSYSGSADGFSVSLWGTPKTIYVGGGGDSPGMFNGLTYHYEFYTGGSGTPPGGNPNVASLFSLTGNGSGTLITSAPAEGEGTYYVYSQIAFYNIGSNSGTVALYSSTTTNPSTPNDITPAELYNPAYQSVASFTSIPLSASPILFGAGSGADTSYVYIYWALMRAYPPNGVMPSVSFGSAVPTYTVTFTESGLPSGTTWYVNLSNGQSYSGTGTTITFNEPNGSYSYTIATVNKIYAPSQSSGTFTVNGANVNIGITFNLVTYKITFTESGLPLGTTWSVTLNNITKTSTNGAIIFNEPNGSYLYIISGISGYRANKYSGTINVKGNPVSNSITWTVITYPITITENGIPNGTSWSATLTGTTFNGKYINVTLSSTTNTITFNEPNGSYSYIIHLPSGYQSNNAKGSVNVSGNSAIVKIKAQQTMNYLLIGIIAVVIIIAIVIVVILLKRRKNKQDVKELKEPPKQN